MNYLIVCLGTVAEICMIQRTWTGSIRMFGKQWISQITRTAVQSVGNARCRYDRYSPSVSDYVR